MELDVFPIFRQKIGNVYHFDILAVNRMLESYTHGYVLANSKTGTIAYSAASYINEDDMEKLLKTVKKHVVSLESIFQ